MPGWSFANICLSKRSCSSCCSIAVGGGRIDRALSSTPVASTKYWHGLPVPIQRSHGSPPLQRNLFLRQPLQLVMRRRCQYAASTIQFTLCLALPNITQHNASIVASLSPPWWAIELTRFSLFSCARQVPGVSCDGLYSVGEPRRQSAQVSCYVGRLARPIQKT